MATPPTSALIRGSAPRVQALPDFGTLVRGKYAQPVVDVTNVVVLDPKVAKAFPMIVLSTRHCEGCFAIGSPPLAQLPVQDGRAASGAISHPLTADEVHNPSPPGATLEAVWKRAN